MEKLSQKLKCYP